MPPSFKKTISFSINLKLFEKEKEQLFYCSTKKWQFITFTLIKKGLNFIDKLRQTCWQVLATYLGRLTHVAFNLPEQWEDHVQIPLGL